MARGDSHAGYLEFLVWLVLLSAQCDAWQVCFTDKSWMEFGSYNATLGSHYQQCFDPADRATPDEVPFITPVHHTTLILMTEVGESVSLAGDVQPPNVQHPNSFLLTHEPLKDTVVTSEYCILLLIDCQSVDPSELDRHEMDLIVTQLGDTEGGNTATTLPLSVDIYCNQTGSTLPATVSTENCIAPAISKQAQENAIRLSTTQSTRTTGLDSSHPDSPLQFAATTGTTTTFSNAAVLPCYSAIFYTSIAASYCIVLFH
ncbi:uncharacterized protein LOC135825926 [Sycon ciliatum]|uniref:uncharacterized protein LOC135825926 n=1 Tax=Sycon ciliatum TaxID=27933 RepID=UPI0031F72210